MYAAETGFKLSTEPDTVRAPDVAFVSRERAEAVGEVEGYWTGAPDLAVEVISPDGHLHRGRRESLRLAKCWHEGGNSRQSSQTFVNRVQIAE